MWEKIGTGKAIIIVFVIGLIFAGAFLFFHFGPSGGIAVEVMVPGHVYGDGTAHIALVVTNVGDVDIGPGRILAQIDGNWTHMEGTNFIFIAAGHSRSLSAILTPVWPGRHNARLVLDSGYTYDFTFTIGG